MHENIKFFLGVIKTRKKDWKYDELANTFRCDIIFIEMASKQKCKMDMILKYIFFTLI